MLKRMLVVLIIFSFAIFGCVGGLSENPQEDIIGYWKSTDGSISMEFTSDSKLHMVRVIKGNDGAMRGGEAKITTNTNTVFLDDTHILGSWETYMQAWEVKIRGNQMTLIAEDGERIKLQRIE